MSFKDELAAAEMPEGFAVLDEGTYEATLDNVTLDTTKSPAKLTIEYKIADGDFKNTKVFSNFQMKGASLGFLKKTCKDLQVDYSTVEKPEDFVSLIYKRANAMVELYVKPKEHDGKTYNQVYLNGMLGKTDAAPNKSNKEIPF